MQIRGAISIRRLSWFAGAAVAAWLVGCTAQPPAPVVSIGDARTAPARVRPGPPPAAPQRQPEGYQVQSGDTLYSIAWGQGLDYRRLAEWNGIRAPYTIYAGQKLNLTPPPGYAAHSRLAASTPKTADPGSPERVAPPSQLTSETTLVALAPAPPKRERAPEAAVAPSSAASAPPVAEPAASAPQGEPTVAEAPPPPTDKPQTPHVFPKGPLHWAWPADGEVVERFDTQKLVKGIRIAGQPGQAVRAAEAGEVVYSNEGISRLGPVVIIKHNEEYLSAYSMNRALLVDEGEWVEKGAKIAEMGADPKAGSGLLHFEIRLAGDPVDPLGLLGPDDR